MKQRIKLTHSSNHPRAKGEPGDVIECDNDIAERFIAGRGAVLVAEAEPKRTRKRKASTRNDDSHDIQSDERASD